jgi:hypothetical protein
LNNFPVGFGERDGFSVGVLHQFADLSEYGVSLSLHDDRAYLPDLSGTVGGEGPFSSDALPTELLDLARFASFGELFFSSFVTGLGTDAIVGRVDSLIDVTPVVVHEPSTLASWLCGGLGLLGLVRMRTSPRASSAPGGRPRDRSVNRRRCRQF